ncbi:zinc finger protein CONSTANS-LIKE 16-like [Juglans microcarpa x Juglans regia]|uniref:zinc finger protein CONSTANS-LIKE 16-like n=1 Tax=Juglans microcarpa x Juglans regia TaxID=2249226 RepID=UPI001B7E9C05|nr:zinc finger protein CONSTANS-LIKE 16-like [Juglans microcarpa x Juglans regia]
MITEKKAANAVGGKTARACDSCVRRRASWFCAADDAFLCQACDASVHSANQLASRHERVRLQISSVKPKNERSRTDDDSPPAWHRGFTRKARTPRHNKPISVQRQAKEEENVLELLPVVPEIGSEVDSPDACNEEHELLYRVPIFDPFAAELCHEMENTIEDERTTMGMKNEVGTVVGDDYGQGGVCDLDDLHGFLSSEMELAGFAADVENLLGKGLDDEESAADIKGLGLLGYCKEEDGNDLCIDVGERRVKVEEEDQEMEAAIVACDDQLNPLMVENMRETLDWKFDYELQQFAGDQDQEKATPMAEKETMCGKGSCEEEMIRKEMFLRLNYEEVIKAWAGQGCPWTTGTRPELNPDPLYCWPDFMGEAHDQPAYGDTGVVVGIDEENHAGWRDHEVREARVSRYREKRRTRLFSKKIRYQVRKLNAEKRPRMKGRFVKRTSTFLMGTSIPTAAAAFPYLNK